MVPTRNRDAFCFHAEPGKEILGCCDFSFKWHFDPHVLQNLPEMADDFSMPAPSNFRSDGYH